VLQDGGAVSRFYFRFWGRNLERTDPGSCLNVSFGIRCVDPSVLGARDLPKKKKLKKTKCEESAPNWQG
jgi:hypothetical protein